MNSNKMIIKFLNQISIEEKKKYLNNDNLIYLLAEEFKDEFVFDETVRSNMKFLFAAFQGILLKIAAAFKKNNISYIMFKGISLAYALYDEPYRRAIGDIDIFVEPNIYNRALELLIRMNYKIKYESGIENPHHIVLTNDKVTIELHKNLYHPITEIDETFLISSRESYVIKKCDIITFNKTAMFLHLIYHLYMDTYMATYNLYASITQKRVGTANRFLFRAYEIALFAEKFSKDIRWYDIISDIKTQKLRIIFKYMVDDILEIFPNAFPQELKKAIYNKSYIENEDDMLFYKFLEGHKNHKQEKRYLLCEFIEKFWQRGNNNALLNFDGSAIVLEDKDFNEFKCICNISRDDKNIYLEFTIKDNDIFFSDLGNYDTQKSDGIHLILCSTTEYSYNSIFFFPKNTKEYNKVIPYDFLESRVIENDIIASYEIIKNGYKMNVTLTEEFITKNHLESFFYLGLVVSSCSSKTKHREKQLVLSSPADQWYNPLHFAKINI